MTKSALLREASTREQLRKEFLEMQEAVKATEVIIPFVFYDGTNIPGGICKVKKGDFVWVLLDRSRKVGAELGVGGGEKASSRREWARVGVDDLMLVRGEVIIPHVSIHSSGEIIEEAKHCTCSTTKFTISLSIRLLALAALLCSPILLLSCLHQSPHPALVHHRRGQIPSPCLRNGATSKTLTRTLRG